MAGKSIALDTKFASDQMAQEIANLFITWDSGKVEAKRRWAETVQYTFATSTRETTNAQNAWSHSTHIPKIAQIHDNLSANYMAAIFPHEDWLKWVGFDIDAAAADKRLVLEGYAKTKHMQNQFKLVMQKCIGDWILYGNCFARVDYVVEHHIDPKGNAIVSYAGPKVERISPYDIVFDPSASSFHNSPKIIRSLKSIGDLKRDLEEKPELGYDGAVVDRLIEFRSTLRKYSQEDINKTIQLRFDGFSNPADYINSNYVEFLEFYGDIYDMTEDKLYKNHLITIVDRQWVIRRAPILTSDGKPPIFHCGWRIRPDNAWAMGPLDNLIGMQYYINHLENARADALDQMIFPTRVLVGDVEEEGIQDGRAGGRFIIPSGDGSVENLVPDTTILNADFQINAKQDQMELYAGAPREAMGVRTPGEKTKFEVASLENAASRMFNNKANYFEEEFMERIINCELDSAIRNMTEADTVAMENVYGAVDFTTITKDDLISNGKLMPMGARHFARESQLAQDLSMLQQTFQADPLMAQHFPSIRLAKVWEDILGFKKYDLVAPFGRMSEQQQGERLAAAAAEDLTVEGQIDEDGNIG